MISKKSIAVARWEFIERAKRKSYIIGLLLTPSIFILFSAGPAALESVMADRDSEVLAVYDGTGSYFDSLKAVLDRTFLTKEKKPVYMLRRIDAKPGERMSAVDARIDAMILKNEIPAALIIPPDVTDSLRIDYRARNVSNIRSMERIERSLSDLIIGTKLKNAGLTRALVTELNKRADLRSVRVSEAGGKESGFLESFGVSYFFLILMLILVLSSGQMLVRSLVEEKSNRIVEVLVSSCSPSDLMFGKIFGLSALGFFQVFAWSLMLIIFVLVSDISGLPLESIWLILLYVVLGFLLYAAVFVALGSLASTEQEAQQMTGYLSLLFTIPLVIAMVASQSPNNPVIVAMTMIPFLTPSMMIIRLPVMMPPLWEIALSLALLVLTILLVIWVAGKVFRVGILLTGKRPSLDEIVRWIRA